MRAWQVTRHGSPTDALELADLPPPEPGPGEVRVVVRTAALGLPDVLMCRSTYPLTPGLPFVPGQEVCGVVDRNGEGVDFQLGARVMAVTNFFDGRGGFAEATIARATSVFRVPDAMADLEAAGFHIGMSTAWIGLVRRAGLEAGEWVLVLGAAGGSGAAAVGLGRALGARVIAVVSGAAKATFATSLGAEAVVDRTHQSLDDVVGPLTGGHGVDVIYDPVGGDLADAAARHLARGGRLLAVGFAGGRWAQPDAATLVRRNASVLGVYAGGYSPEENGADHEALLALVGAGRLVGAARSVPFAELPAALESIAGGHAVGKLVTPV